MCTVTVSAAAPVDVTAAQPVDVRAAATVDVTEEEEAGTLPSFIVEDLAASQGAISVHTDTGAETVTY